MSERLMNPADVAERLNVSRASAYNLLKQGVIPSVRMGKMIRVRREDLEKYIYEKVELGIKGKGRDASGAGN